MSLQEQMTEAAIEAPASPTNLGAESNIFSSTNNFQTNIFDSTQTDMSDGGMPAPRRTSVDAAPEPSKQDIDTALLSGSGKDHYSLISDKPPQNPLEPQRSPPKQKPLEAS
eukprot:GILI01017409.1.p1 GENE.GILI01017409.1~~GILI01017409.1.p1  ORF type:complete len:111 (-),score=12.52 GILI01017409.1:276-608(-)